MTAFFLHVRGGDQPHGRRDQPLSHKRTEQYPGKTRLVSNNLFIASCSVSRACRVFLTCLGLRSVAWCWLSTPNRVGTVITTYLPDIDRLGNVHFDDTAASIRVEARLEGGEVIVG